VLLSSVGLLAHRSRSLRHQFRVDSRRARELDGDSIRVDVRIAKEIGVSRTTIYDWCKQGRAASDKIYLACQKLAGLSGFSVQELLSGLPPREPK
jgi:hypothetical protein